MIRPAKIRSIRAYKGETQEKFAKRFHVSRYTVIHWERYGVMDQVELERRILDLGEPHERQPGELDR